VRRRVVPMPRVLGRHMEANELYLPAAVWVPSATDRGFEQFEEPEDANLQSGTPRDVEGISSTKNSQRRPFHNFEESVAQSHPRPLLEPSINLNGKEDRPATSPPNSSRKNPSRNSELPSPTNAQPFSRANP